MLPAPVPAAALALCCDISGLLSRHGSSRLVGRHAVAVWGAEEVFEVVAALLHPHESEAEVRDSIADEVVGPVISEVDEQEPPFRSDAEPLFREEALQRLRLALDFDRQHLFALRKFADGVGTQQM